MVRASPDLKIVRRGPGQRGLGARRIDFVAEIVARPIHDELDQPFARPKWIGHPAIEMCTDGAHDLKVAARLAGADRVGGARLAVLQDAEQGGRMVLDEDPVSPVGAVAVNRQ